MGTSSFYPESPAERDTGISWSDFVPNNSRSGILCKETLKKGSGFYWEIIL